MGCGAKAAADDYQEYCNWHKGLSEGELELIKLRKQLKQIPNEFALKRDQIEEVDKMCGQILKITDGTKHKYDLDN